MFLWCRKITQHNWQIKCSSKYITQIKITAPKNIQISNNFEICSQIVIYQEITPINYTKTSITTSKTIEIGPQTMITSRNKCFERT